MLTNEFAHLHLHSDASFIDGLGSVKRTLSHAKSLGFNAIGLTDHGTLTNTITFNETARELGLKPVIGLEGYVRIDGVRFHITLLANGNTGFSNLVKLNNLGVEKFDRRPTFDIGDFALHNEGVVLLTGCPESPMQIEEDYASSKENFRYLKKIFGDRMFIEMMLVNYGTPYERALQLHRDFPNTPIVLTNDVHYAKKGENDIHERLMKMSTGGFSYNSEHLYLATPDDLLNRLVDLKATHLTDYVIKGMKNAGVLSQKLGEVTFNNKPKLPHIANPDKKLWKLIEEGYRNKLDSGIIIDSAIYRDRYLKEFNVIKNMDFSSYFLILHDIINYSHKHNIWVGKGRGSGAGSLILFLIGITGVDPIKHDLYFERFLNPKRVDMPDVDVDIEKEKRSYVIDYAFDKWGAIPVANYSTYKHKSLMVDLAKSFRVDKALAREAGDFGENSSQFQQICDEHEGFKEQYDAMKDSIRHLGKHAGGVVIASEEIDLPLIRTKSKQAVVSWTEGEHRELSKVGLVKFDLLGLSSGSVVRRLEEKTGVKVPYPTNGHEVFSIFQNADTDGIFQFGSDLMKGLLRNTIIESIDDITAINALARNGPLDSGATYEYLDNRTNGTRRYLHPDIDHMLDETLGTITYQEQYMRIYAYLIDGDIADGDLARKVLAKSGKLLAAADPTDKLFKKYLELESSFFDGADKKGWKKSEAQAVWDEIKTHAGYSFNKSHAISYAILAWEMAWFKYYYPVQFFTELLNVERDDNDKVAKYLTSAVLNGLEVKEPDINVSTNEYIAKPEEKAIYLPLTSIRYVSDKSYNKIKDLRPFHSIEDYRLRAGKSVGKRGREGFLNMNAFNSIIQSGENPSELLEVEDNRTDKKSLRQKKYLGFALPTAKFIASLETAEYLGQVCGIVNQIDFKENRYGGYYAVKLIPDGFFWHTSEGLISEGEVVRVIIDPTKSGSPKLGKIVERYEL